jgi:hypothetical protein
MIIIKGHLSVIISLLMPAFQFFFHNFMEHRGTTLVGKPAPQFEELNVFAAVSFGCQDDNPQNGRCFFF